MFYFFSSLWIQKTIIAMTYSLLMFRYYIIINYFEPIGGSVSKLQTGPNIKHDITF